MAMPRRKLKPYSFPDQWLEQIIKNLWENKSKGFRSEYFHPGGQFAGQVVEKSGALYPIGKLSHPAEVCLDL